MVASLPQVSQTSLSPEITNLWPVAGTVVPQSTTELQPSQKVRPV